MRRYYSYKKYNDIRARSIRRMQRYRMVARMRARRNMRSTMFGGVDRNRAASIIQKYWRSKRN